MSMRHGRPIRVIKDGWHNASDLMKYLSSVPDKTKKSLNISEENYFENVPSLRFQ